MVVTVNTWGEASSYPSSKEAMDSCLDASFWVRPVPGSLRGSLRVGRVGRRSPGTQGNHHRVRKVRRAFAHPSTSVLARGMNIGSW